MDQVHLCLSDLLDQDLTAYEYFQTLPPSLQDALYRSEIATFSELQAVADKLRR